MVLKNPKTTVSIQVNKDLIVIRPITNFKIVAIYTPEEALNSSFACANAESDKSFPLSI